MKPEESAKGHQTLFSLVRGRGLGTRLLWMWSGFHFSCRRYRYFHGTIPRWSSSKFNMFGTEANPPYPVARWSYQAYLHNSQSYELTTHTTLLVLYPRPCPSSSNKMLDGGLGMRLLHENHSKFSTRNMIYQSRTWFFFLPRGCCPNPGAPTWPGVHLGWSWGGKTSRE